MKRPGLSFLFTVLLAFGQSALFSQTVGRPDLQFAEGGIFSLPPGMENTDLILAPLSEGGFMSARTTADSKVEIRRFSSHGMPDDSFGENGIRSIVMEGGIEAMYVTPDSNIYVCGYVQRGRNRDVWLMHLFQNGKTNPGFGTQGVVTFSVLEQNIGQELFVYNNRKILVGGTSYSPGTLERDMFVARFLPNGQPDPGFGEQGIAVIDHSSDDRLEKMALREDSRIVIAGNSRPDQFSRFFVCRLLPNGVPDPAFGMSGSVTLPVGHEHAYLVDMALLEDDRILVGGNANIDPDDPGFDLTAVRLLPEGQWDPSFGNNGVVTHNLGGAEYFEKIAVQRNQQILIAGKSGMDVHIFRLKASGHLDPTYGTGGYAIMSQQKRVSSLDLCLDHDENLLLGLGSEQHMQIRKLFGNPHLPGLDQVLAFDWQAGDHESMAYSGISLGEEIRMDAWLGGPMILDLLSESNSGPKQLQPVSRHIRFFAHLAMDDDHRLTVVWDSEGLAHWYLNGSFQSSWNFVSP